MVVALARVGLALAVSVATVVVALSAAQAADEVRVGTDTHVLAGTDVRRAVDALVVYTRAKGQTTAPTAGPGFEAAVVDGRVTAARDGQIGMDIPANGVVLSGRGESRTWLRSHASVGAPVVLPAPGGAMERLPDLGIRPLRDVSLDVTSTGRRKLRFTTVIANGGRGPMEVIGKRPRRTGEMTTRQRVYRSNGTSKLRPTPARMYWSGDGHDHWHVRSLVRGVLVSNMDGATVRRQQKFGFCLFDNEFYDVLPQTPNREVYRTCGTRRRVTTQTMGVSVGWADKYTATLITQYIDVTTLPVGTYRLRAHVDWRNWFKESNDDNNAAWADIEITRTRATVVGRGGGGFS